MSSFPEPPNFPSSLRTTAGRTVAAPRASDAGAGAVLRGGRSPAKTPILFDPDRPDYDDCTGCSVCVLPCPVWQQTRDVSLTLKGRARALQGGATLEEIAPSLSACTLCGACEPVCPEGIDTVGRTLELRASLAAAGLSPLRDVPQFATSSLPSIEAASPLPSGGRLPAGTSSRSARNGSVGHTAGTGVAAAPGRPVWLLPGAALGGNRRILDRIVALMGGPNRVAIPREDGREYTVRIEAGIPIGEEWEHEFVSPLVEAKELVVVEGLLHAPLRRAGLSPRGLGEALLGRPAIRRAVGPGDLYVIESRGYHADFERLVKFYDAFRVEAGCVTNLDLQRAAIPTGAASLQTRLGMTSPVDLQEQVHWMLEGRKIHRVIVESVEDLGAFRECGLPVLHLSELEPASAAR